MLSSTTGRAPAAEVLQLGELPDPDPGPGEVRVRVGYSGVNPGDTKKRAAYFGSSMPYPRVVPHAFSDNIDLDAAITRTGAVIATYATRDPRPGFDFWSMLFANLTVRLLGRDEFPTEAKRQAATDLTSAARAGALSIPIAEPLPLHRAAAGHDRVDTANRSRVLLSLPA